MSDISIVNKESVVAVARPGPSNHGPWLAQLESAQWQHRMRSQGGGQAPEAPAPAGPAAPAAAPAAQAQPADPLLAGQRGRAADGAPGADARAPAPAARATAGAGAAPQLRPQGAPALAPLQQARVAQGAPQEQPAAPPQRAAADWQAQHAHVMAGAAGARLWLRDARYQQGDGNRLLLELRGQFARLGVRLAEFTLNGARITPSQQPDHRTTDSFQRGE